MERGLCQGLPVGSYVRVASVPTSAPHHGSLIGVGDDGEGTMGTGSESGSDRSGGTPCGYAGLV